MSGGYQQLLWSFGVSHKELIKYADHIWKIYKKNRGMGLFPEWILQQLDDAWMLEPRSPAESSLYIVNIRYVRVLKTALKSQPGRSMEWLAITYLLLFPAAEPR